MRRHLMIVTAAAVVAASVISFRGAYEADLFWHLAQGREVASGHLVRTNLFSYVAPDYPQPYTGWLFDLGLYGLWTAWGATAVQAAQAILIALALVACAGAATTGSSGAASLMVSVLIWLTIEPRAIPRPHVFSFAALAGCVWLIEQAIARKSSRPLLWAIPLVVVWSNVHVESVFGVALLGIFAGGEWLRPSSLARGEALRAVGIAALALAATLITPYGAGILRYLYENTAVPSLINIAELQPPYLPNYRGFFAFAALAGMVAALRWRSIALWELAALMVFGVLGFRYLRLTPMAAIATAAITARGIDAVFARGLDRRAAVITTVAAGVLLSRVPATALVSQLNIRADALTPQAFFSEAAMQYARDHAMAGPVYVSNNIGGFVEWSLYPSARVFQDSRLQAYPRQHFQQMLDAWGSPARWAAMVAGVDWAVLSRPRDNELSGTSRFSTAEWAVVFRDEAIDIVVRKTGAYGQLATAPAR
ncbi:MAG: hypothetical protein ABI665_10610 [Vicinamibacterales bacterium]